MSSGSAWAAELHRLDVRKMIGAAAPKASGPIIAGRFRVVERLGRGAHGEVVLCDDLTLERRVALKLIRKTGDLDLDLSEARACARLRRHPNVVQVHDVGEHEGRVWIAMEWIEGETLSSWLKRKPSLARRLNALEQLADGIAAMHRDGVVHRDIKPSNVMMAADGRAILADFGLARSDSVTARIRDLCVPVGTRGYWAPEVEAGHPADERSDQFSFIQTAKQVLGRRGGRLVARGSNVEPRERWPSMVAVADHIRSRRRVLQAGPVVVLFVATAVALLGKAYEVSPAEVSPAIASALEVPNAEGFAEAARLMQTDERRAYDTWREAFDEAERWPLLACALSWAVSRKAESAGHVQSAAWIGLEVADVFEAGKAWRLAGLARLRAADLLDAAGDSSVTQRACAAANFARKRC